MAASATTADRAAPILSLRGIGRRFGGVIAVADVDLDVRPGERRAILGPNGAGKTTLFNLISGELQPTTGGVELFGEDVTRLPARTRARMGLSRTFQTSRLFGGLSVEDNLYLAVLGVAHGHLRLVKNAADEEMRAKARDMAELVGLAGRLGDLVSELSHGEQRQLEVGMARVAEPKLMMLDEPAAGLSRAERVQLTGNEVLRRIAVANIEIRGRIVKLLVLGKLLRRPYGQLLAEDLGVVANIDRELQMTQEVVNTVGKRMSRRQRADFVEQFGVARVQVQGHGVPANDANRTYRKTLMDF